MAVKLRMIGQQCEVAQILAALESAAGVRVVDASGPRPSRYEAGVPVYAVAENSRLSSTWEDVGQADEGFAVLDPPTVELTDGQ